MRYLIAILAVISLTSCLREDSLKKDYSGYKPKDIGDGWKIGSCKINSVDSSALNNVFQSVYDDDKTWPMRSLLVFRNGELIAESYLKEESDRTRPRAIWSCTKQVMGILTGILWDRNDIFLNDRLEQYLKSYTDKNRNKENITVQNLLTMKSGIGFYNDKHSDVFRKKEVNSSIDFVLELDLDYAPGTYFNYNDGDPQLLSGIIQNIAYKKTYQFARDELFNKIGMHNYSWASYDDGITMGAFGIQTTPREIAKVGQLVLNKGMWDTVEVVSEQWIDTMLSVHTMVPDYTQLRFGYYWWIYPSKNYYFMWGHGGQYVFLIPEKNAMIVITSLEQLAAEFAVWVDDAASIADRINACLY